jgi:hypothetical protein
MASRPANYRAQRCPAPVNRSIVTDTIGLLLAVIVCAASFSEDNAGMR